VKDSFGKAVYLSACETLAVAPVAQIVKYLEYEELRLAHYGIGIKGVKALVDALKVLGPPLLRETPDILGIDRPLVGLTCRKQEIHFNSAIHINHQ
jgi:hypothetical protein